MLTDKSLVVKVCAVFLRAARLVQTALFQRWSSHPHRLLAHILGLELRWAVLGCLLRGGGVGESA